MTRQCVKCELTLRSRLSASEARIERLVAQTHADGTRLETQRRELEFARARLAEVEGREQALTKAYADVCVERDAALRRAEAAERKFAYWDAAQARNPLPAKVLELEASLDEAVGLLRLSRTMLATVAAPLAMDFPQIASEIGRTVETLVAFLKAHP